MKKIKFSKRKIILFAILISLAVIAISVGIADPANVPPPSSG